MKKYSEDIAKLHESDASIDTMLENEIKDLYREQITSPAFVKGGPKTGKPDAIQVLENMRRLVDKYTTSDDKGRLVLKSKTEIQKY